MTTLHKLFLICLAIAIVGVSALDAHAAIYGYSVRSDGDDTLYAINLENGSTIKIGTGTGFRSIEGLTWDPVTRHFFGADDSKDVLVKINPSTGVGVEVGDMKVRVDAPGLTISDTGVIYMTREKRDSPLYRVNKLTGEATLIGDTGIEDVTGLAFLDGKLYGVSDETDSLYTLNTATGAATLVGAFDERMNSEMGAAGIEGFVWAVDDTGKVLRIDPLTGKGTHTTNTLDGFDDLSHGPPIPEPSSLVIFSMTAFGMAFIAIRRRRREVHSA